MDGLSAGSAGLAGSAVKVDDDDSAYANSRSMFGYRRANCCLLRAGRQPERSIFDIASLDDAAVVEQQGGPHAEVAVRRISMCGNVDGPEAQLLDQRGGNSVACIVLRHGTEANGCAKQRQVFANSRFHRLSPIRAAWTTLPKNSSQRARKGWTAWSGA